MECCVSGVHAGGNESSALIGFIEEVLSMEGEMDQEELLDVFYNLIDYISGYYIKQLQKKR